MIDVVMDWSIVILLGLGVFFTFVSAVGVLRLPDVYARAHTASQTDTLGAGLALAAVAIALYPDQAMIYTVLLLFFVFITNPTAAHAIARSASEMGIEPWTADDESAEPVADGGDTLEESPTSSSGGEDT